MSKTYAESATVQLAKMRTALSKAKAERRGSSSRAGPRILSRRPQSAGPRVLSSRRPTRYDPKQPHGGHVQRVKGHGDYSTSWGKFGSNLGATIGSGAGALGDLVTGVGKIFGFGDYSVKHNSLMEGSNPTPKFASSTRSNIVTHREYLGDIIIPAGTAGQGSPFQKTDFPINPGMDVTFPWLSNIAANYEEYRIVGMLFQFKSNYSDAVVTNEGGLGSVMLATEYNSLRTPFSNKLDMENHEFATSSKPSIDVLHPIECAVQDNPLHILYTRSAPPASGDLRVYDLGRFTIATQGIPMSTAEVNLGELWITYQVELLKPQLVQPTQNYEQLTSHWVLEPASIDATHPFGADDTMVLQPGGTLNCELKGELITFPESISDGNFQVFWQARGTASALGVVPTTSTGGISGTADLNLLAGSTQSVSTNPTSAASTRTFVTAFFSVTAAGGIYQITPGTFPASLTSGDLIINQINPGVLTKPRSGASDYRIEQKGKAVESKGKIELKTNLRRPQKPRSSDEPLVQRSRVRQRVAQIEAPIKSSGLGLTSEEGSDDEDYLKAKLESLRMQRLQQRLADKTSSDAVAARGQ